MLLKIALVVTFVVVVWQIYSIRKKVKAKAAAKKENLRKISIARRDIEEHFDNSIAPIIKRGGYSLVDTGLILKQGEKIILALEKIRLYEQREQKITGKGTGVSFRVIKGITSKQAIFDVEAKKVMQHLDTGEFTLTNKRIVFNGTSQNREFPISRINTVVASDTGIIVEREWKQKTEWYAGFDKAARMIFTSPTLQEEFNLGFRGSFIKAIIAQAVEGEFDPVEE